MVNISFLAGELFFTGIWLAVRIIIWIRAKGIDFKRELMLLLMYINLAVIIRFVFFPFFPENGKVLPLLFDPAAAFPPKLNLVPFIHIAEFDTVKDLLINIVGNTAMFIPTGIILPILFKDLDTPVKVTAVGALMSLSIEILQLPFFERTTDIDDLMLNTLGCFIGEVIVLSLRKEKSNQEVL